MLTFKNKFHIQFFISILLVQLIFINSYFIPSEDKHNITNINSFSFGSCYNGVKSHKSRFEIFDLVEKNKPDFFIWTGDAAYYTYYSNNRLTFKQKLLNKIFGKWMELNNTKIEKKLNKTKHNSYYSKFANQHPVIGTWDDNDYAVNDGNKNFIYKEDVKTHFLNFLDEPLDSKRRGVGRGIYETYTFGDKNTHKTVRVILLDVRFDKSGLFENNRDILGEEQWNWLDNILENNNETFTFIVSGTQFLPIDRIATECWFPESREKLFKLISKLKKNGVILITGDIHNGQILRTPCIIEDVGYHIYEFTSSGLGHYCTYLCEILIDYLLPSYYKFSPTVTYYNFGKIDFKWGESLNQTKIIFSLIDINNVTRFFFKFDYAQFTSKNENLNKLENLDKDCLYKISRRFKSITEYITYWNDVDNLFFIFLYLFFFFIGFTILLILCKIMYFLFNIKNCFASKALNTVKIREVKEK